MSIKIESHGHLEFRPGDVVKLRTRDGTRKVIVVATVGDETMIKLSMADTSVIWVKTSRLRPV